MSSRLLLVVAMLSLALMIVSCQKDNDSPEFGIEDIPAEGNADNGQQLFRNGDGGAVACSTCHSVEAGDDRATGPSLAGIAGRAGSREEGENTREYMLNSIIAPGKHIVDGYSNTMPSNFAEKLSRQQIADLIAYLMRLE